MNPETISPTAHYTGYVWYAHGQSHEAFATRAGRFMYQALRAPNAAAHAMGLPTLPGMLLARHRLIDLRLAQAIEAGEISQVVEVAAGLSPRGWRFCSRFGDALTYVEADLPGMIARKRRILARLGGENEHHRTVEIDALSDDGATSIGAVCESLDGTRGTAIITEGLLNYFSRDHVEPMWRRFARALARFPRGLYLSDLNLREGNTGAFETTFKWLLGTFVRGKTYLDFASAEDVERALDSCGLDGVVLDPRDFELELAGLERHGASRVRVIEAMPSEGASGVGR
jgi:O-methyltransferase involved in polyketide biosynthesis